jgi:AcrR family transcriptional regulator
MGSPAGARVAAEAVARRRTQGERRDATVGKLIKAVVACLNEHGYAATTTPLVAKRAGVTRGALQHHFASKNELLLAAHVHLTHLLHERLKRMLGFRGGLEARCRHVVETLWEVFGSPEYAAILELMLGTRGDPQLHAAVSTIRTGSMREEDLMWARVFADVALPPARLRDTRYLVWMSLAGLSIQAMFPLRRGFIADQLQLISEALHAAVASPKS